MSTLSTKLRSKLDDAHVLGQLAGCALQPYRPVMAHLIITRRCNLSCGYCFEYDRTSKPVALETLRERIDHLARLRALFVTLTGGESLLHPDIVELVSYVRERGMTPVMNTNGYLLTETHIRELGEAGLFGLQLSIDNVKPNETTNKSLKPLLPKLRLLAEHATFRVRINTVLGSGSPEQAVEVARAVVALGFDAKCSLVRDDKGAVVPVDEPTQKAYAEIRSMGRRAPGYMSEDYQLALVRDGRVDFKCRSGARYFMVCEDGLVHLCESSWGNPGVALAEYDQVYIRQAFHMPKSCAQTCAVAYAHQVSRLDKLRSQKGEMHPIEKRCWSQAIRREAPLAQPKLDRQDAA